MNDLHSLRRIPTSALVLFLLGTIALLTLVLGHKDLPTSSPASAPALVEQVSETPAEDLDAAFLADLFGPDVDVSTEQATVLIELAHRYCTFVVEGQIVPGAEVQTREGWIETLTMPQPSLTTGWTVSEATKLLDVAEAAYCSPAAL